MEPKQKTDNSVSKVSIGFTPFEGRVLHPSLDIQDDLVLLGFRYRNKENKEEDVFVISVDNTVSVATENPITVGDKLFHLDKLKERKLAHLEEKWGYKNLEKYIAEHYDMVYRTIPSKIVFRDIVDTLKSYVELEEDEDYHLLSAWIVGSYFYPVFAAYPFIHLKAPKGSGKSQCLTLLSQLCFNAIKARPSLAALGDTVDALRGTYLIDQADSLARIGNEEMRDILCDSYKRSGGKRRIVGIDRKKGREILEFETYAPKAFASIKELPTDLRDRCFVVQLTRSTRGNFPDPDSPGIDWRERRAKLYELLLSDHVLVSGKYLERRISYKNDVSIVGRKLELWLPLEVILLCFGESEVLQRARDRFFSHYESAENEPGELEIAVIEALRSELESIQEIWLQPKDIVEKIREDSFYDNQVSTKQRAAAVGWVIKKFNLASGKDRTKEGVSHLFRKEKIEGLYASYFKSSSGYTPLTSSETVAQSGGDSGASALVQESFGVDAPTSESHTPDEVSSDVVDTMAVQEMQVDSVMEEEIDAIWPRG